MSLIIVLLEIILVDIILGGDNAFVIAMSTKRLERKNQKKITFLATVVAILLRAFIVTLVIKLGGIDVPGLYLVAGLSLVVISLDIIHDKQARINIEEDRKLKRASITVLISDLTLGVDNALVIGALASTATPDTSLQISLVVFSLLISFPIILFGADFLGKLILKYVDEFHYVIITVAFLLIHMGLVFITKDLLFVNYTSVFATLGFKLGLWLCALFLTCLKVYLYKRKKKWVSFLFCMYYKY